ncbi:MAG TPA: hypothetical protein VGI39_10715 [Polyangiaceae bacterium]
MVRGQRIESSEARVALAVLAAIAATTAAQSALAQTKADPSKGSCAALVERGDTLRNLNEYEKARAAFTACARDRCSRAVARMCAERLAGLDALTPTILPRARDERGRDVPGVTVSLDGAPNAPLDGQPIPLDPGEHRLRFELAFAPAVEKLVVVRTGEKRRPVVVVMHAAAPAATAPPPEPHLDSANVSLTGPEVGTPQDRARVVTSITLLVLAAVGGGVGEYFMLQATHEQDTASALRNPLNATSCTNSTSPTCQSLHDAVDAQYRDLDVGRVLLGSSVVLALGAAATWLFWPSPRAQTAKATWLAPAPAPGGGALYWGGTFG